MNHEQGDNRNLEPARPVQQHVCNIHKRRGNEADGGGIPEGHGEELRPGIEEKPFAVMSENIWYTYDEWRAHQILYENMKKAFFKHLIKEFSQANKKP